MTDMQDTDGVRQAYDDVRNDDSEVNWCVLKYDDDGKTLRLNGSGESFEDLKSTLDDDNRAFAFLRVQTGDEMSKRMKFVLITWVGANVTAMKKAKMSTEKAFVKKIWPNFAVEMNFDDIREVNEDAIRKEVMRAGGANYGTGQ